MRVFSHSKFKFNHKKKKKKKIQRLAEFGYHVGIRILELVCWREKNSKRETRIIGILVFIQTNVWKTLFGKQADSLEKNDKEECKKTKILDFLLSNQNNSRYIFL